MVKILNLYSGIGGNRKDWGDKKTTSEPNDQDIAEVIEDALDKIEDMGMDIGENAREVSEMFNRAISARL